MSGNFTFAAMFVKSLTESTGVARQKSCDGSINCPIVGRIISCFDVASDLSGNTMLTVGTRYSWLNIVAFVSLLGIHDCSDSFLKY